MQIDAALLTDSFNLFENKKCIPAWLHLRELSNINGEFSKININIKKLSKKLNITKLVMAEILIELNTAGLIYHYDNDEYYFINEKLFFFNKRSTDKEKYYTKNAIIDVPNNYVSKYLKKISPNGLKLYWMLYVKANLHLGNKKESNLRMSVNKLKIMMGDSIPEEILSQIGELKFHRLLHTNDKGNLVLKNLKFR